MENVGVTAVAITVTFAVFKSFARLQFEAQAVPEPFLTSPRNSPRD
jgi:hypothetical protein